MNNEIALEDVIPTLDDMSTVDWKIENDVLYLREEFTRGPRTVYGEWRPAKAVEVVGEVADRIWQDFVVDNEDVTSSGRFVANGYDPERIDRNRYRVYEVDEDNGENLYLIVEIGDVGPGYYHDYVDLLNWIDEHYE